MDLLQVQHTVGFELDCGHGLIKGDTACAYTLIYQSIIGQGQLEWVQGYENNFSKQQSQRRQ